MKKKSVEMRALEMAVIRFIKYGRCNCDILKCEEKDSPSCKGKIRTCQKAHKAHFLSLAKKEMEKEKK
jgi:hypothetical protein